LNVFICSGFNESERSIYKPEGEKINHFPHKVQSVTQMVDLDDNGFAYIGLEQRVDIYQTV